MGGGYNGNVSIQRSKNCYDKQEIGEYTADSSNEVEEWTGTGFSYVERLIQIMKDMEGYGLV